MLVQIEVQAYNDPGFRERMFTYYYRIRDRYQKKITSWAIFTDPNKNFLPDKFEESFLGTSLIYKFNTYKILDQPIIDLEKSNNPFAVVILTILVNLQNMKGNANNFLALKLELARNL
jgi:hypothetical protein